MKKFRTFNDFNNVSQFLRQAVLPWRQASRAAAGNISYITGQYDSNYGCDVHHINKGFYDIMMEAHDILDIYPRKHKDDYSMYELEALKDKVLELHFEYGLGILIEHQLHKAYHNSYKQINQETLDKFKDNQMQNKRAKELSLCS